MPNTPALVGEGMSAVSFNQNVNDEEIDTVMNILKSFGKAEIVPENLMDTVTAVSGSSPAYIFMLIEAMADAAVLGGICIRFSKDGFKTSKPSGRTKRYGMLTWRNYYRSS